MKKLIVSALALSLMTSHVFASELEQLCVAFVEGNGGEDTSGCTCLAENSDADVTAELLQVTSQEDLDGVSDAAKEVLAACFPQ